MADLLIMLRRDPDTGKQNITIKLHSNPDALPHEHEDMHRELVQKLIGKGLLKAEEIGIVTVEREEIEGQKTGPLTEPAIEERQAQQHGN